MLSKHETGKEQTKQKQKQKNHSVDEFGCKLARLQGSWPVQQANAQQKPIIQMIELFCYKINFISEHSMQNSYAHYFCGKRSSNNNRSVYF